MTSSELLIDTLTTFSDTEPTSILIIWINTAGEIQVASNCGAISMMGMSEYVKMATFRAMSTTK